MNNNVKSVVVLLIRIVGFGLTPSVVLERECWLQEVGKKKKSRVEMNYMCS